MKIFFKGLRFLVLRTNHFPSLFNLAKAGYLIVLKLIVYCFKKFSEIDSIYLCGSLVGHDWVPGDSDIDLNIIFKDLCEDEEINFLSRFLKLEGIFEKLFPIIRRGNITLLRVSEVINEDLVRRYFPLVPSSSADRWKLLYGKEYRSEWTEPKKSLFQEIFVDHRIRAFYETLFWRIYKRTHNRKTFLRQFYGSATKGLYLIYFTHNQISARSEHELFDYFLQNFGFPSKELIAELKSLKEANYWTKRPFEVMSRCLFGIIKTLDCFYFKLLQSAHQTEESSFSGILNQPNQDVLMPRHLSDLVRKISEANISLMSILFVPDWDTNKHDLYLILSESCDFNSFQKILKLIRDEEPKIKKEKTDIWVTTENILNGEMYFLGGYFTVGYFYIMKHGRVISGSNIKGVLRQPSEESMMSKLNKLNSVFVPVRFRYLLANHAKNFRRWLIYDSMNYRLLKEKGVFPISIHDTWKEYQKYYGEEKETSWFSNFHNDVLTDRINEENRKKAYRFVLFFLKKIGCYKKEAGLIA